MGKKQRADSIELRVHEQVDKTHDWPTTKEKQQRVLFLSATWVRPAGQLQGWAQAGQNVWPSWLQVDLARRLSPLIKTN